MNKVKEMLNKDVKEYNLKLLIISGVLFITLMGFISYKLTNRSYALFSDTVTGTKTLTLHYESPKIVTFDPDGGVIPAGTDWTGSGNSATKEVTKGIKYGELPIPTKEGYTFKGWNGKNLFPDGDLINSTKWDANQNVLVTKTNDYIQVIYNQDSSTPGYIYRDSNEFFESGKTYTASMYAKGVDYDFLKLFVYGNGLSSFTLNNTKFEVSSVTFTYSEKSNNNDYILMYASPPTINTGFQIKWLMFEEGTQATEYEPYFVTEDTKVVQNSNHTLKAIWEEEEETQTEP